MRFIAFCSLSLLYFVAITWAQANPLVDAMVDEFFSELSQRQGFNRLRAPDVDNFIGHAFNDEKSDVKCFSELVPFAHSGHPIQVTKLIYLREPKGLPKLTPIRNWTAIQLSSLITQSVEARISTKLPDKAAEVQAAASTLRDSNAQILFASPTDTAANYLLAAIMGLNDSAITNATEIDSGASGVLVPVAELLVQKFESDSELLTARNLMISA